MERLLIRAGATPMDEYNALDEPYDPHDRDRSSLTRHDAASMFAAETEAIREEDPALNKAKVG